MTSRSRRHRRDSRRATSAGRLFAAVMAVLAALTAAGFAAAHPLGNFTINHYAGIRVETDRLVLDVVIDLAEIPTFQARQDLDTDGDGEVSDREIETARERRCRQLAGELTLSVGGTAIESRLTMAGLSFPPGSGGLSTMRVVCGFEATFPAGLEPGTTIAFSDESFPDRIGWREIVVEPSGVVVEPIEGLVRDESVSARLTAYPDSLEEALVEHSILFAVSPGGPTRPAAPIRDAVPVAGPGAAIGSGATPGSEPAGIGAVPGGVAGEIPSIFQADDLTPLLVLASLLVAAALGAGHALTPGHGKTLMAAYLVGTRGTPVHALGLGLSVSVSHTLGIVALALVVVGAQGVLAPDLVARAAPVAAAVTIAGIGAWMLVGEVRRRTTLRHAERGHGHRDDHEGDHRPGVVPGSTITWRSLFVLGLAGGLIPSTNALLVLLGSIAAGRPAFGLVLVAAFGVGMALVMTGTGLVLVLARGRLDRIGGWTRLGRVRSWLPLGAAVFVLGLGLYLAVQAVVAPPAL